MAIMKEIVTMVYSTWLAVCRLKRYKIYQTEDIFKVRKDHILNAILGTRKLLMQWVPCMLPKDNKRNCEACSRYCLMLYTCNPKVVLCGCVTVDETCIRLYMGETKEKLNRCTSPGERALKRWKTLLKAGKAMAIIFWDSQDVVYTNYLENSRKVKRLYYFDLLGRFDALRQRNGLICCRNVLFHYENALTNISALIKAI